MRGQSARRVANGMAFWGLLRAGMAFGGLLRAGMGVAGLLALAYDARTGVVSARSTAGTVVIFR